MRVRFQVILLVAAVLTAFSCAPKEPVRPASLIFTNGAVYTVDPAQPWAGAVAVADGKILYAGTAKGAGRFKGAFTTTIDLGGRMLLPGFQDSHIHLITGGIELSECNLSGLPDKESVFAAIREYAARNPEKPWVTGGGWELPVFPQANPVKEDLDKLVPDRPACLSAADGHSSWANTRALRIAGITGKTPDPPGGRIERDPRTGEPTGTLRESAAGL
ncbi:MAG: amidohydrolase, partial [Candidatus Aminicenantales bacterium]